MSAEMRIDSGKTRKTILSRSLRIEWPRGFYSHIINVHIWKHLKTFGLFRDATNHDGMKAPPTRRTHAAWGIDLLDLVAAPVRPAKTKKENRLRHQIQYYQ